MRRWGGCPPGLDSTSQQSWIVWPMDRGHESCIPMIYGGSLVPHPWLNGASWAAGVGDMPWLEIFLEESDWLLLETESLMRDLVYLFKSVFLVYLYWPRVQHNIFIYHCCCYYCYHSCYSVVFLGRWLSNLNSYSWCILWLRHTCRGAQGQRSRWRMAALCLNFGFWGSRVFQGGRPYSSPCSYLSTS